MYRKIFNRNKLWIITTVVFVVLVTFLDNNSILDKIQLSGDIRDLRMQKKYYLERIDEDSTMIEMLKDDAFLERYGREVYFMRKRGETIYIIEE